MLVVLRPEVVCPVGKALRHHGAGAPHAFLGRLKDDPNPSAERFAVCHDPACERKPRCRVHVVPAGMHETRPLGGKPQVDRQPAGFKRLRDANAVDLKSEDRQGAGPLRIDRGARARPAVERNQKILRNAGRERAPLCFSNFRRITSHHGRRFDECSSRDHLASQLLDPRTDEPGRLEFGPAFFGTLVQAPPASGEVGEFVGDVGLSDRLLHVVFRVCRVFTIIEACSKRRSDDFLF